MAPRPTTTSQQGAYAPVTAIPVSNDDPLAERFVETITAETVSTEAMPYLEVVAPATLPEGYTFEAEVNGHPFTVQVPLGGVEQGQKFTVPFAATTTSTHHSNNSASLSSYVGSAIPRVSVPVGAWRDGLCACCAHNGIIHPVIWNAWLCPLILLGQIMVRLKLTFLGNETPYNSNGGSAIMNAQSGAGMSFKILAGITILRFVITQTISITANALLLGASTYEEAQRDHHIIALLTGITYTINIAYAIFLIYLIAITRYRIRSRYGIPEQNCRGCEDCCCAFWCQCCAVSQMARHTADYDNYAAKCCSETGLGRNAPSIV